MADPIEVIRQIAKERNALLRRLARRHLEWDDRDLNGACMIGSQLLRRDLELAGFDARFALMDAHAFVRVMMPEWADDLAADVTARQWQRQHVWVGGYREYLNLPAIRKMRSGLRDTRPIRFARSDLGIARLSFTGYPDRNRPLGKHNPYVDPDTVLPIPERYFATCD